MNLFKKFKEDNHLLIILVLHLILAACHLTFNLFSDIQYHAEFRATGCILIALFIFLFGRRGMSYGFLIYACTLIYLNMFYNYGTIFFLLIAYGAYPKIKWPAVIIYSINVFVSFSLKKLLKRLRNPKIPPQHLSARGFSIIHYPFLRPFGSKRA